MSVSTMPHSTWTARLAWGLLLLFAGGALATWGLTRWDAGARFLGVAPEPLPGPPPALVPRVTALA
ncbi:MAG: hypothetical protein H0W92_03350, partial [Sphingomonas sp.]|nr:hypothetical protein [Sphingomonas sp.]